VLHIVADDAIISIFDRWLIYLYIEILFIIH